MSLSYPTSERERRGADAEPLEQRSLFAIIELRHLHDWSVLVGIAELALRASIESRRLLASRLPMERLIASRTELPAEFAEAAASIRRAADRAQEIIRSCRDLVVSGTTERSSERLRDVLRSTEPLILMQPAAAGATLTWDVASELEARVSPTQVQQVLLNLAANGLQAMDGMSDPVLAISAARWGNSAVVSVADRGVGIAEAMREAVFEPSVSGKANGMGLGLYLCRLIVAAHGGRIWAEGNPGGGSIFRFTIPLI